MKKLLQPRSQAQHYPQSALHVFAFVNSMRFLFVIFKNNSFTILLITFANSFDPEHVEHGVVPDLDPDCLTL